jgi:hypothetical protein
VLRRLGARLRPRRQPSAHARAAALLRTLQTKKGAEKQWAALLRALLCVRLERPCVNNGFADARRSVLFYADERCPRMPLLPPRLPHRTGVNA